MRLTPELTQQNQIIQYLKTSKHIVCEHPNDKLLPHMQVLEALYKFEMSLRMFNKQPNYNIYIDILQNHYILKDEIYLVFQLFHDEQLMIPPYLRNIAFDYISTKAKVILPNIESYICSIKYLDILLGPLAEKQIEPYENALKIVENTTFKLLQQNITMVTQQELNIIPKNIKVDFWKIAKTQRLDLAIHSRQLGIQDDLTDRQQELYKISFKIMKGISQIDKQQYLELCNIYLNNYIQLLQYMNMYEEALKQQ